MRDRIMNAVSALRGGDVRNETLDLSQIQQWSDLRGGFSSETSVNHMTAARHSAVFACVRLIAGSIGQIPLKVYQRLPGNERSVAPGLDISNLLAMRPNPIHSASMFWRIVMDAALKQGNGYAFIERDRNGKTVAIWPFGGDAVSISRTTDGDRQGRLTYTFAMAGGARRSVDQDDVLHIPGSTEWDGFKAKSAIQAYGSAAVLGLDANRFSQSMVDNASSRPTAITYPSSIKDGDQVQKLQEHFRDRTTGANRNLPAIISNGGEIKELGITAGDAQLLETRQFQIEEVARIFGCPPNLIGHITKTSSWGSGVEEQTRGFVTYTLGMHLKAIEQEVNYKLFRDFKTGGDGRFFCEYRREALVQMNLKERYEAYSVALGGSSGPGWKSANEVRRDENLPPLEGGEHLVDWKLSKEREPEK